MLTPSQFIESIPPRYIYAVAGGLLSVVVALSGFGIRALVGVMLDDRKRFMEMSENSRAAMTNHLPHLLSALEDIGKKQDATNRQLAEQTGYLRAICEREQRQ